MFGKKLQAKERWTWKEIALLHLGVLLVVVGVYFFKFPNHFIMGGVSGLSVLLGAVTPLSQGLWTWMLNGVLLIVGFCVIGKGFALGTAYSSLLLSTSILLLEYIAPIDAPITGQPILELTFAAMLPAIGAAILFNLKISTGGTDIIAMILHQKINWNIGRALAFSDIVIALISFSVFHLETVFFSLLGLLMKGFLVDALIENFNEVKYFTIVTSQPEKISEYITDVLHRSSTVLNGKGIFTGEERSVFLCVVKRHQAVSLRDYIKSVDENAFITISNTSQIIGKGFQGTF